MKLGRLFKSLRKEKLKLTQHELAKALGISQSALCKIENGKIEPSLATFIRMRKILPPHLSRWRLDEVLEWEV
jgi:DNA-binding XRE family transcriptional regulator